MPAYDGNYVTNADVRAEGVTTAMASDAKVDVAIKAAERFIESWCGRWFYRRTGLTITLDGGDTYFAFSGADEGLQTLFLAVPIINLTSITINDTLRTLTDFIVLNRIGPIADDRWNPRIISKNYEFPQDGIKNIALAGDFGFVEDTTSYTVPELIKTAALKQTIRQLHLKTMTDPERDIELNSGMIIEEETPGYRYRLNTKSMNKRGQDMISGDPEIDDIIEMYRFKRYIVAV